MTRDQIQQLIEDGRFAAEGQSFQLAETHISWVLLSGQNAYKIKKPVKFDFLDFSTLEKRRYYCQRELELNSRFCQGVYLEVQAVVEGPAGLSIGGKGATIDYALHMKRLDGSRQMNLLLEQGLVTPFHMQQLGEKLSIFHTYTDVIERPPDIGAMQASFSDLASVANRLKALLGPSVKKKLMESLVFGRSFLGLHAQRLLERGRQGYIIDGHGDLHSRNIFLLEEPIIFDCIEFNDAFRYVDVLDELAFLCMDLDYYGFRQLEAPLLNAYMRENDCIGGDEDWALFLFFKWYRANVRLKVKALQSLQEGAQAGSRTLSAIEEYWQLYSAYYHELRKK